MHLATGLAKSFPLLNPNPKSIVLQVYLADLDMITPKSKPKSSQSSISQGAKAWSDLKTHFVLCNFLWIPKFGQRVFIGEADCSVNSLLFTLFLTNSSRITFNDSFSWLIIKNRLHSKLSHLHRSSIYAACKGQNKVKAVNS